MSKERENRYASTGDMFKEADLKGTNALLYPRLGDWAVIKPTPTGTRRRMRSLSPSRSLRRSHSFDPELAWPLLLAQASSRSDRRTQMLWNTAVCGAKTGLSSAGCDGGGIPVKFTPLNVFNRHNSADEGRYWDISMSGDRWLIAETVRFDHGSRPKAISAAEVVAGCSPCHLIAMDARGDSGVMERTVQCRIGWLARSPAIALPVIGRPRCPLRQR